MVDIHNYQKQLEKAVSKIENSKELSKNNKKSLIEFYRSCIADGIKAGKLTRYMQEIPMITKSLDKDYKDYTKEDVQKIIVDIENSHYADWTKYGQKIGLRKFLTWAKGCEEGEFPPEVKWIKMKQKNFSNKLPEDLLTEEEVKKMIISARRIRDKALISSLYESGCRISEILTMKIKNISFDKYGCIIKVSGKTGSRRVRLIASSGYMQNWMNNHPHKDEPDAFVWAQELKTREIIKYDRARLLISSIAKKADIKKKVNPHNFRHSRASLLANHLTEAQLKEVFGWTQASRMASVYVHLSGKNTDDAILKVYGKVIDEEVKGGELNQIPCIRCKTENEVTNKFCKLCGMALDEKTQTELIVQETNQTQVNEVMSNLMKDPEVINLLMEKLKAQKQNA